MTAPITPGRLAVLHGRPVMQASRGSESMTDCLRSMAAVFIIQAYSQTAALDQYRKFYLQESHGRNRQPHSGLRKAGNSDGIFQKDTPPLLQRQTNSVSDTNTLAFTAICASLNVLSEAELQFVAWRSLGDGMPEGQESGS